MCAFEPDGQCEVWRESAHLARKQHRCSSCRCVVSSGEPYSSIFTVYEKEPATTKLCFVCWGYGHEFMGEHGSRYANTYASIQECLDGADRGSKWRIAMAAMKRNSRNTRRKVKP